MDSLYWRQDILYYDIKENNFHYVICKTKHNFLYVSNKIIPIEPK